MLQSNNHKHFQRFPFPPGGSMQHERDMERLRRQLRLALSGRTGSGIVASRADEYRRRAQQCLEMARTFGDRDVRGSLCYMAEVWLKLADRYQDADELRPAMQQQQQIQPKDDSKKDYSPPQLAVS